MHVSTLITPHKHGLYQAGVHHSDRTGELVRIKNNHTFAFFVQRCGIKNIMGNPNLVEKIDDLARERL